MRHFHPLISADRLRLGMGAAGRLLFLRKWRVVGDSPSHLPVVSLSTLQRLLYVHVIDLWELVAATFPPITETTRTNWPSS